MRSVGEVNAREGEDERGELLLEAGRRGGVWGGEHASVVGANEGGEVLVLVLVMVVMGFSATLITIGLIER